MKQGEVTFITPSYLGDLERFALQRESLERCGIDIAQIVIVDAEDFSAFGEIPFQRNLRILTTGEVLPKSIDRRRRAARYRRRDPRRWQAWRTLHGWYVQQLAKLAGAAIADTEGAVCLDSDVFFVRKVESRDFFTPEGRLHLYETADIDTEMAEWLATAMRFLGISPQKKPPLRYVHAPVPLHTQVVRDMHEYIEKRHGESWSVAMANANVYEYPTYGSYARYLNQLDCLAGVKPTGCLYYWWPEQFRTLQNDFLRRCRNESAAMALINSNGGVPVSAYRHLAEQAWEQWESEVTAERGSAA